MNSSMTRRDFAKLTASAFAFQALARHGFGAVGTVSASDELTSLSLTEAAAKIRSGVITSTQLTEACLARIAAYDSKLDAFILVMKRAALAQAKQLDAEQKAGKLRGPLHGVPLALKDNIDTAGTRTTAGSGVFEERVPTEDAPVTARLVAAGAVVIGKTNMHEFAMGGGETSFYGPARNPWSLAYNTGGSSSGSGAAVAAQMCFGALGTDTGGSVRMPASYCGLVGLKPTYGLVPIRGIVPLVVSLDHCGPIVRSTDDAALMMNVLAGYDLLDITSVEHPKEDYVAALSQPVKGLRLGTPMGYFDHLDPEVSASVNDAIGVLSKLTQGVKDVKLPPVSNFMTPGAGEILAYHQDYIKTSLNRYMPPLRRRLEAMSKEKVRAADYIRAKWALENLRLRVDDSFQDFDLVVLPTQRILPPLLSDLIKRANDSKPTDPTATSNCTPFNLFGLPALSLPCGFSKNGLPIGLMIAGPRFSEGRVLALAHAYERETQWHLKHPVLAADTAVPEVPAITG